MSNDSPTPRTDALLKSCSPRPDGVAADALIRLARQLERELAQARAAAYEEAAKICDDPANGTPMMCATAIRAAGGRG